MHRSVTHELRLGQPWNHPQHPILLAIFEICLEADQVVEGPGGVVLTQLHDGVGPLARAWVAQPHRSERTVGEGFLTARAQHLDREAPFKEIGIVPFEVSQRDPLGVRQSFVEGVVFGLGHRAVDVVARLAFTSPIARRAERDRHIDALKLDDGRDRIVEVERVPTGQRLDSLCQVRRGEGAAGQDDGLARCWLREGRDLLPYQLDVRIGLDSRRDRRGEALAVDR